MDATACNEGPCHVKPSNNYSAKLLLFDIDGTLLKTHGAALRALNRAARRLFGEEFDIQAVDRNGRLDPDIFAAGLRHHGIEVSQDNLDRLAQEYLAELPREMHTVRALPGAVELVEQLRPVPHVTMGLVTGNLTEAAQIKLGAVDIAWDWFVANGFGEQEPTRAALVQRAWRVAETRLARSMPAERVIVIGDTPRDVECARANGCFMYAVASGNYTIEELADAGADIVMPDLTNPEPLWQLVHAGRGG